MSHRRPVRIGDSGVVATWTARTRLPGPPEAVLALLTDPDAIATWAPVGFEIVDYEGRRLIAGDRVRVRGTLAGPSVSFDVDVAEADDGRLALTATGPIRLDVDYRVVALGECSELRAAVTVSGNRSARDRRGLTSLRRGLTSAAPPPALAALPPPVRSRRSRRPPRSGRRRPSSRRRS